MGLLFQDSSRLGSWMPAALFALMSCAAPLLASDAWPANLLPSSVASADARLGTQDAPMGAQAPAPDLSLGKPDDDTASFPRTGRPQRGRRHLEDQQAPIDLARKQRQELLKSDFEKMKRDAAELATFAKSLQEELDKSNEHILSMKIVEKAQKIENLAKRISKTARSY